MHIDSYQFGSIVIDETTYSSDCIVIGDAVDDNWWRKHGHMLAIEDLQSVTAAKPSVLVVGCGASAMMRVPPATRKVLRQRKIELIAVNTHEAVTRFNQLAEEGANVAAALHLTC